MFQLYPHQSTLETAIHTAWQSVRSVLAVLSTGGGKTIIFSSIIHDHNGAAAAIVHRKEIVGQIAMSLAQLGVKHRVIAPPKVVRRIRRKQLAKLGQSYVDQHAQCGVVSVQTLTSRGAANNTELQKWLKQITLAVYDEGHHYVDSGSWAKAVHVMDNAKLLFVTATPDRADGKGLGSDADGFCDMMVQGPSTAWLIENGYLSPYKYYAAPSDFNVEGLAVTASGDFNAKALRSRVIESHLVGDVVDHYSHFACGKKAIVFAPDVETATEMSDGYAAKGYAFKMLCGATDGGERDKALDDFYGTTLDGLTNVDLFDEGFDVAGVVVAVLGRKTESLAKFLQMIGRALRPVYADGFDLSTKAGRVAAIAAGSKPHAIIIDPVRNWERHGMPDWPRNWTLDRREKRSKGENRDTVPQKVCDKCTQPYPAYHVACIYCGHVNEPAGRSTPEQVEGDLVELDVAALAALFNKINDADMSDEDYARGQFARKIPAVGRGADLKRHQAAKYRRKVLREMVGWWVGAQAGRDMREIHRRFYFRFGIDIGLAFTLSAKETDALLEIITKRFTEDML